MKYPARTNRDSKVTEMVESGQYILAGRVIGLLDGDVFGHGFVLEDASGRVEVFCEKLPQVGSIIEVTVEKEDQVRAVGEFLVLAECEDFFINRNAPNYKRSIIDLGLGEKLKVRARVYELVRRFFVERGFDEVETPSLVRLPGMEPYLDVFKTRFLAQAEGQEIDEDMYLITSPEYAMKKLLVSGMEKIFQICKCFRNKESFSSLHNPEFSMLEWYRAYASYEEMMDDTEELVKFIFDKMGASGVEGEWERLSVAEAFKVHAGVDLEGDLFAVARTKGYQIQDDASYEDAFFSIFLNEVEPKLGIQLPTILYDYPVDMAALAKVGENGYAERFEVYVRGVELCNGFTELNDPEEQLKRLEEEKAQRAKLGRDVYSVDNSFIEALRLGMPPAGGNALGLDRLIMLVSDSEKIEDVMSFSYRDL